MKKFLYSLIVLILFSCSGNNEENPANGDFSFTITGDINRQYNGNSCTFLIQNNGTITGNPEQITIIMTDGNGNNFNAGYVEENGSVSTGTKDFQELGDIFGGFGVLFLGDETFTSGVGSITFTEISENAASGSLQGTFSSISNQTITVSGNFNARK